MEFIACTVDRTALIKWHTTSLSSSLPSSLLSLLALSMWVALEMQFPTLERVFAWEITTTNGKITIVTNIQHCCNNKMCSKYLCLGNSTLAANQVGKMKNGKDVVNVCLFICVNSISQSASQFWCWHRIVSNRWMFACALLITSLYLSHYLCVSFNELPIIDTWLLNLTKMQTSKAISVQFSKALKKLTSKVLAHQMPCWRVAVLLYLQHGIGNSTEYIWPRSVQITHNQIISGDFRLKMFRVKSTHQKYILSKSWTEWKS